MSSKRWSSDEKIKLMELYSKGLSFDEIGQTLNRSNNAIKLRLESIVYDNIIKGKSVSVLSRMLNTDSDKVIQMYYSHKSFKQGRGEHVEDIDLSKNLEVTQPQNNNSIFRANTDKQVVINKNFNKLDKLEHENQILEAVIKNYQMKRALRKLYVDGKLNKNDTSLVNQYVK